MKNKFFFGIILVVIISLGIAVSIKKEDVPVKEPSPLSRISVALDWFPYSAHAGLFIAERKGYFKDEGLKVELHTPADPTTVLHTVASGRDDFGITYQPDVLLARSKGLPVVSIMALVQHPLYSLLTLDESGLKRPSDMVGKKVGYAGVPMDTLVLDTMLMADGVPDGLSAVEFVNVGFDLVPALIGKRVDGLMGYFIDQSIAAENQGFPVTVMKAAEYGVPDYYELVIVGSEEGIAKNSDVTQKFVRAVQRGYKDAINDPQGAIIIMKELNPELDVALESQGVALLAPLWKSTNGIFGWQDESRWSAFSTWMQSVKALSPDLKAREAFDNGFVERAY